MFSLSVLPSTSLFFQIDGARSDSAVQGWRTGVGLLADRLAGGWVGGWVYDLFINLIL